MKITRELLRQWNVCHNEKRIAKLVPPDGLTPLEFASLDIPFEGRLFVLLRKEIILSRELRLLACQWADRACTLVKLSEVRSLYAIDMAMKFANETATHERLNMAKKASINAISEQQTKVDAARNAAKAALHANHFHELFAARITNEASLCAMKAARFSTAHSSEGAAKLASFFAMETEKWKAIQLEMNAMDFSTNQLEKRYERLAERKIDLMHTAAKHAAFKEQLADIVAVLTNLVNATTKGA